MVKKKFLQIKLESLVLRMSIKAFVFDMDGVITETANLHYEAWRDEVKPHGINFTEEENAQLKGLPRFDTLRAILKMHGRLEDFTEEQIVEMGNHKNDVYKKMLETRLSDENILPGIVDFLKAAKAKGIKLSVASSSFNAPQILEATNLIEYFDHIVDPGTVANGKPAPDIYIAACEAIGATTEEAVGFEDAMPGVEGLVSAGIKTVAITWGDEGDWNIADIVINSTAELDIDKILKL